MQASFTFNLPEDLEMFQYHCQVMAYRLVINEFRQKLRNWGKSFTNPDFEQVKDEFYKLLEEIGYE